MGLLSVNVVRQLVRKATAEAPYDLRTVYPRLPASPWSSTVQWRAGTEPSPIRRKDLLGRKQPTASTPQLTNSEYLHTCDFIAFANTPTPPRRGGRTSLWATSAHCWHPRIFGKMAEEVPSSTSCPPRATANRDSTGERTCASTHFRASSFQPSTSPFVEGRSGRIGPRPRGRRAGQQPPAQITPAFHDDGAQARKH